MTNKKTYILSAIGITALLLNFLFPGLSFGQSSKTSTATFEMTCLGELSFELGAASFNFDSVFGSSSPIDVFGNDIGGSTDNYQDGTTALPAYASLKVTDTRGLGCTAGLDGFQLTATATDLAGSTYSMDVDTLNNFYVDTTTNITGVEGSLEGTGDNAMYYKDWAGPYTVTAQFNADSNDLTTASTFTGESGNNLSSTPIVIMENSELKLGEFTTGLAYYLQIPGGQGPDIYTTTITFTLSPV